VEVFLGEGDVFDGRGAGAGSEFCELVDPDPAHIRTHRGDAEIAEKTNSRSFLCVLCVSAVPIKATLKNRRDKGSAEKNCFK
jgi:hypothetical protein